LTGPVARDAGRIVEEAISNAVRHGSSTILVVAVTWTPSAVEITVQDNGTGPGGGEPGVGSLMLDLACEGWSLTESHPGTLLRAHVRTAEPGRT
jgi:anti-sigma regulatory factor (Ser/Thr protein kinase)